jgi:hypothetical protein
MYKRLQNESEKVSNEIILVVSVCGRWDRQPFDKTYTRAFSFQFWGKMRKKKCEYSNEQRRAIYIHPKQTFCFLNSFLN